VSAPAAIEGAGCQLYLISPRERDLARLAADLEAALSTGDTVAFLLRPPQPEPAAARILQQTCAGRAAFLLQDDVELALELGADGVHLGDPTQVGAARTRLGPDRIIGASCGHSRHAAMLAGEDGADYIAFGQIDRPAQTPLLELLAWWSELFVLPCLAEAAFDPGDLGRLARVADFIGVSDAVWRHPEGAAAGMRRVRQAMTGG
jgi:thiamine-phosphate pyrophosphorylase